jgi:2'-5' RNA ligase
MRIFLALDLDEVRRSGIGALQRRLARDGMTGIRWTDPAGIHLTLRFCGELQRETVRRLEEALDPGPPGSPFTFRIGGPGTFPPRGAPRVLYLAAENEERLAALAEWAEKKAVAAGLPGEPRPFHPHLTLGRFRPGAPRPRPDLLDAASAGDLGAQEVKEVVMFESHLGPGGARYGVVRRFPLQGSKAA